MVRGDQQGNWLMSPFEPLTLPNGSSIPNRIAKAAMEENMADARHFPSAQA
jgi:2,4-dienoyl-CoA reductase-like NADH-dependent reductase (Old Yellow Enzyme family)